MADGQIKIAKSTLKQYKSNFKSAERAYKRQKRELKRGDKDKRTFYKKHGMFKYPLMADVFDFAEGLRAEPNGRTPFITETKVERNVVYKTVDGKDLVMDIYYPARPIAGKAPAVMDIPGGGWMIHNRRRRDGYARCFSALGAVVAVIDHRLCPEVYFPENLKDCADAYNFLVHNAERFNIDPNNITVTGDSSGGHLSACMGAVATDADYRESLGVCPLETKPASLIFISGAFDFDIMYRIPFTHTLIVRYVCGEKSRKEFRRWKYYKQINLYNNLNSDFPPCYNNGGATDFLCAGEAKRMHKKLDEAGVKNGWHVGKSIFNSMHCYVFRFPFKSARKDMLRLFEWYCDVEKEIGVNLGEGLKRVRKFMTDYKNTLSGRTEC